MQMFVPIDDEHTMFHFVPLRRRAARRGGTAARTRRWSGTVKGVDIVDEYRKLPRPRENNWLQDRDAMRRGESFSGITGVNNEDIAVQESMGPLYDRTQGASGDERRRGDPDAAADARLRACVHRARRAAARAGRAVPHARLRAEEAMIPIDAPWQAVGAYGDLSPA